MATAMVTRRNSRIDGYGLTLLGLAMGFVTFPVFAGSWTITPTLAVSVEATTTLT